MICRHFLEFVGVLVLGELTISEGLSCYQCNADLSMGLKEECNDPYAPGPAIDLVECPQNEPHYCLKAAINYKNVYATVRGCVPSRSQSTYCSPLDEFPEAHVTCKFCNEYACNGSWTPAIGENSKMLIFILIIISCLIR
ncbi:uncharacterized protein LOC107035847 [Diachasma alloeum]|uniref:uncharacterized protein LOC107035847 n=1 Tax=Diachasma alloeum TaxID=454923 RepID=UPI0007381F74|nr:uncharacterized protein LOC107035847 [Diachasma alloeum]